jgi:hypothetical protein
MNDTKVVADVTRCYEGTVNATVARVRSFCAQEGIPEGNLVVVGRCEQLPGGESLPNWREVPADRWEAISTIRGILISMCSAGPGNIVLGSYDGGSPPPERTRIVATGPTAPVGPHSRAWASVPPAAFPPINGGMGI